MIAINTDIASLLLGVLTLCSLIVVIAVLIWPRKREQGPSGVDAQSVPALDPAKGYPTSAEQDDAMARLARLPQMLPLLDGSLVDLSSGARLFPCDCSEHRVPHLAINWGGRCFVGLMTSRALQRYLSYQERLAVLLPDLQLAPPAHANDPLHEEKE